MKASIVLLAAVMMPGVVFAEWGGDSVVGRTTVDTGSLNIAVQPNREAVPAVGVENRSDMPARCSATFSNGAQFSETRVATVVPGKRATMAYGSAYLTAKVDIDVKCKSLQPQRTL